MAIRYVDSAAVGTNDGTSWANAFTKLANAAAVDTAGDTIYVKNTHSETTAASVTYAWASINGSSTTRIICVSDTNDPPTQGTGAVIATTGASNLTLNSGAFVLFQGIRFRAGDGSNAADVVLNNSNSGATVCHNCAFELAGNNAGSDMSSFGCIYLQNCTFKAINSGSTLTLSNVVEIVGGSIESGSTFMNPLFNPAGNLTVTGFDFSNLPSSYDLTWHTTAVSNRVIYRDCKMPSSWSGSPYSAPTGGSIGMLHNSDSGDTNYFLYTVSYAGVVVHETTRVRTGGATDGTTPLSWKMTSSSNASWPGSLVASPEIVVWNDAVGVSKTATVEILSDSATSLTDDDIWLEVVYLGTSGVPLGSLVTDTASTFTVAASNQTPSYVTWTTTGMTNPNKQKLSVTFTPQEKGFIHATVKLAKASTTVYVCPKLVIE
jgi:hypothetical protein